MKYILIFTLSLLSLTAKSQDCETIAQNCKTLLNKDTEKTFIPDGQIYTAFLDRENAEFNTTFFGGTTYRIAASAGSTEDFVVFSIKDPQGNILFTNKNYKNAPYWDFKVTETLPVTIESGLDPDFKVTGCVVMMIGFQK